MKDTTGCMGEGAKARELGVKYESSFFKEFIIWDVLTGVDDFPNIFDIPIEVEQRNNDSASGF